MPPIQTVWNERMEAGVVGRRVNMEEWNTLTGLAEGTEADPIGFAQPVAGGTAGEQVVVWDGSGRFRGLTEADQTLGADTYPEGHNVPVMEFGVIWALAGGTCTRGEAVGWDDGDGTYENASTGSLTIPNAEFDSDATSGDLVKIRLRRIPGA